MNSVIRLMSMNNCHRFGRPYGCSGISWIFPALSALSLTLSCFASKTYMLIRIPEKVAINNYLFNTPKYDPNYFFCHSAFW